jgi:hypothetical protein
MISFDTNILVYATASVPDVKAVRARDLIARAMRAGWTILLLQTLVEFPNVAIRKSEYRSRTSEGRSMLGVPIQAANDDDRLMGHYCVFRATAFEQPPSALFLRPPTISFRRCRDADRGGGRGTEAQ